MATLQRGSARAKARFNAWGAALWLVLLLAALGAVQYLQRGDYPYLAGAAAVIVICAGCILRQDWARTPMRVVAVAPAAWSVVTGVMMLMHLGDFELARQKALVQPQLAEAAVMMIDHARALWWQGIVLKGLAVPLLLWLAWMLGKPAVAGQFRTRARR